MKKIILALLLLSLMSICVFTQSSVVTRPRVVTKATPVAKPTPNLNILTKAIQPPPPPPVPVEDDEVLNIETNLVTMPVSVLDYQGNFIKDLEQKDFEIFENGVQQQVDYFASVKSPFTVVLLLDISPSTKYKINDIQDAAISFVDEMRREDKLIVMTFSKKIQIISKQKSNFHRIRRAIRRTKFGEGTSIYETVDYAMNNLLNKIKGRKAIVILSDGVDTSSRLSSYHKTLKDVEKDDTLIYSVRYNTFEDNQFIGAAQYSIGSSPAEFKHGKNYLTDITNASGGKLFEADTKLNLEKAFKNIAISLRWKYSLGYYPENDGEDGERRQIKIRVKSGNYNVKAKESYIVSSENKPIKPENDSLNE